MAQTDFKQTEETPQAEPAEPPGSGRDRNYPTPDTFTPPFQPNTALNRTPRPALWADVPDEKWDDWRWQLANRLNSLDELAQIINLTPEEIEGLTAEDKFRVDITPYFASLIDPDDPFCPVRRQVIPQGRELEAFEGMMEDSLAEDKHSPVPGLVHRRRPYTAPGPVPVPPDPKAGRQNIQPAGSPHSAR